jgi:hypothetical protein
MKYLMTVVSLLAIGSIAMGKVSTRVCLADANTPLELADPNLQTDPNVLVYRDIMVGTKLTIIVDSNITGSWDGGLYVAGSDRDYGVLSARDFNDLTFDWEGSHLEAAGDMAQVENIEEDIMSGFELFADNNNNVEGDWFILDYNAINVGVCTVDFYDYYLDFDNPVHSLKFSHVRSRDYNQDTKVDFADLALFAKYWLQLGCTGPDWCAGMDLNTDGVVDHADLKLFTDFWLEKTQ